MQDRYSACMSNARSVGFSSSLAVVVETASSALRPDGLLVRLGAENTQTSRLLDVSRDGEDRLGEGGFEDGHLEVVAALVARWRSTTARLHSLAECVDPSHALAHWLRVASEALGAHGAVSELRMHSESSSASATETLRAVVDTEEHVANAVMSLHHAGCALSQPRDGFSTTPGGLDVMISVLSDVRLDVHLDGLLVRHLLEDAGVHSVITMEVKRPGRFAWIARFIFDSVVRFGPQRECIALLLADRFSSALVTHCLERRLHVAESRLHAILEGAGDAILTVGVDGRVVDTNHAASLVFGFSQEEARGMPLSMLFPSDPFALAAGEHLGNVSEARARRRDGSEFAAEVVAGAGAQQRGKTLLVRDASARRDADARTRQCERLASMGTLVAGLGHDLNNALLPLRAHVRALENGRVRCDRVSRRMHFRSIRRGFAALQSLADGLHLLATEDERSTTASVDPAAWWGSAAPLLAKALHERATLDVAIDPALPRVAIDEQSLTRVALALLINAAEAMPVERPRELSRVLLRGTVFDSEHVTFEFADNGIGMGDDARRRAFDAYFTTKPRGIGTGLGLPIVRSIVDRVGARIELNSQPGVGTTVRILMPIARPDVFVNAPLTVAVVPSDGRLLDVIFSLLRTYGVDPIEVNDPEFADVYVASDSSVELACVKRWCDRRPARDLIVIGSVSDTSRPALAEFGVTFVASPIEISNIDIAIRQVLASRVAKPEE
jgi:PAS domain S-box-containing protein